MARYKAKAKSNKKQKKEEEEEEERDNLAADEYFVGSFLDAAPPRTRPNTQPRL